MARRRPLDEPENHDRWMVSYADFLTLLFAFFVVMYSISSNEGKYRILSQALVGVFNDPERSTKPIQVGEEPSKAIEPTPPMQDIGDAAISPMTVDPLQSIADSVRNAFGDLIESRQLTIRGNELWLEIELNSSLLFGSGDAMPSDQAFSIIDKVATILKPFANPVHVEGFTDNKPISTAQFPTNWELSSARSASVVRLLVMGGVEPERLASVGYGEFHPVASNATAQGRARNRRVVLVISRNVEVRRSLTRSGSAKATADATLKRAGTQTAPATGETMARKAAVN